MNRVLNFNNDFAVKETLFLFRNGLSIPVYRITSYHTLVQYVGYAKYINRFVGNVYLRGQHELYDTLIPSIFRNVSRVGGFTNRNRHIGQFVKSCAQKMTFISELDEIVREPLLQHYGIGTRWIDLVDNLWVALWFGSHTWHTKIFEREYKNVIPRNAASGEYMYLLLVCTDGTNEDRKVPGLYKGIDTYTVDLRKSAPSIFLRPHAQHALLMRSKQLATINHTDLANYVVGIAKLSVSDCLNWIGVNGLTSARNGSVR